MSYCSLADARAELKADSTVDDDRLLRFVRQTSARINAIMSPRTRRPIFEPYIEERGFVLRSRDIASAANAFYFRDMLLAFTAARVNATDVTASLELWPLSHTPVKAVRFVNGIHSWYEWCRGYDPSYVYVTGTWGIRADYSHAWVAYDSVKTNPVTPADTSFLVNDAGGDDPYGLTPRFSPGQLLRIGAGTEIMLVTAADTTTDIISISRAQNGSSLPAGNYAAGETVYVFEPEEQIRRVVARQAALMYARLGAFQVETLDGVGVITYPQDLLVELEHVLTEFQYV